MLGQHVPVNGSKYAQTFWVHLYTHETNDRALYQSGWTKSTLVQRYKDLIKVVFLADGKRDKKFCWNNLE